MKYSNTYRRQIWCNRPLLRGRETIKTWYKYIIHLKYRNREMMCEVYSNIYIVVGKAMARSLFWGVGWGQFYAWPSAKQGSRPLDNVSFVNCMLNYTLLYSFIICPQRNVSFERCLLSGMYRSNLQSYNIHYNSIRIGHTCIQAK